MSPGATDEPEAAALEAGRLLFARECRFVAAAGSLASLPPTSLTEITFAGRSNVGKSSLINALTGRTRLARTSNTPGRTQEINFFDLDGRLLLVDLPGYGFAQVSKERVARWTELVNAFLRGRPTLRRVCLLIDGRHGVKPPDRGVMTMLDEAAVNYQVVLTKCDKVGPTELAERLEAVGAELAGHVAAHPDIVPTSTVSGAGIERLRAYVAALAAAD